MVVLQVEQNKRLVAGVFVHAGVRTVYTKVYSRKVCTAKRKTSDLHDDSRFVP